MYGDPNDTSFQARLMQSRTPPLGSHDSYSQEQSVKKTTLTKSMSCGEALKGFKDSELDPVPEAREDTNEDGTFISSPKGSKLKNTKNFTTSFDKSSTENSNSVDTPNRRSGPASK